MKNLYPQEPLPKNVPEKEPEEVVSGIVDSMIYQNEENGYTVCEIEDSFGEPVTLVGIIPYLTEGDKITAYGTWINHPTYGLGHLPVCRKQ